MIKLGTICEECHAKFATTVINGRALCGRCSVPQREHECMYCDGCAKGMAAMCCGCPVCTPKPTDSLDETILLGPARHTSSICMACIGKDEPCTHREPGPWIPGPPDLPPARGVVATGRFCPDCDGRGYDIDLGGSMVVERTCMRCNGTGVVAP